MGQLPFIDRSQSYALGNLLILHLISLDSRRKKADRLQVYRLFIFCHSK